MLLVAAAVLSQRVAHHDEAISRGHRLHICDNDAAQFDEGRTTWRQPPYQSRPIGSQ
jgi:hypothetical protein